MHELPIIRDVLKTVLRFAAENGAEQVLDITLEVGEMHDIIPALAEKYFAYASRGTAAEGAAFTITSLPVICRCGGCGEMFVFHPRGGAAETACPVCGGGAFDMVSGTEFIIREIKIKTKEGKEEEHGIQAE